jgi:hypothetical protein
MALPLDNSFEGGTPGNVLTAAGSGGASGSAFDAVTGVGANSSANYSNAVALHGVSAALQQNAAQTATAVLKWQTASVGSVAQAWGRFYFQVPRLPVTNSWFPVDILDTDDATQVGIIAITSGALLRVANGTTGSNTTGTQPISVDVTYRVEFTVVPGGAGVAVMDAYLYAGESTSVMDHVTRQVEAGGTNVGAIRWGVQAGGAGGLTDGVNPFIVYMDDLNMNASTFPGPVGSPGPVDTFGPSIMQRSFGPF